MPARKKPSLSIRAARKPRLSLTAREKHAAEAMVRLLSANALALLEPSELHGVADRIAAAIAGFDHRKPPAVRELLWGLRDVPHGKPGSFSPVVVDASSRESLLERFQHIVGSLVRGLLSRRPVDLENVGLSPALQLTKKRRVREAWQVPGSHGVEYRLMNFLRMLLFLDPFPFGACRRCRAVYVSSAGCRYCSDACAEAALANRRNTDESKRNKREYMKKYMKDWRAGRLRRNSPPERTEGLKD
jgi:hypothetical protein